MKDGVYVQAPGHTAGELADLLRQRPDVAESDAKLFLAGSVLAVLRPHLVGAERLELREGCFQVHGRDCHTTRTAGCCRSSRS